MYQKEKNGPYEKPCKKTQTCFSLKMANPDYAELGNLLPTGWKAGFGLQDVFYDRFHIQ